MRAFIAPLALALAAGPALAANWAIDPGKSEIAFSGSNSGKAFKGTFQSWKGTIDFDPELPEAAKVEITVDLASAKTGDTTYDKTLPQKDWLDTAASPTATFRANSVRRGDGANSYEADGTLTIRGKAVAVSLPFTLAIDGDSAQMSGKAVLKRLDFGIGKSSDGDGSWVSLEIPVDVKVVATKQ